MDVRRIQGRVNSWARHVPFHNKDGDEDTIRIFFVLGVHEFLFEPGLDSLMVMSDFVTGNNISTTLDEDLSSAFSKARVKIIDSMPGVRDDYPDIVLAMPGKRILIDFYNKRLATLRQRWKKG